MDAMRKSTTKLVLHRETLRGLATAGLHAARGGGIDQSMDGHVCESDNACPGTFAPYPCATDVRCETLGPCDPSFGPCV